MNRKNILILIAMAVCLYFFKLGSFSLYDAAETTYGEFVKNMLGMKDWLTFHYNGQIIFDKPPLYYWFAVIFSKLIGFNEWAMRLPAAISGLLTVIVTYLLGKTFYNKQVGFLSGIIVMTAFQFLVQSRIAELDVVLTLLMTSAILCFYLGYTSGEKKYYTLSYVPMALAVLIKGILGVALPGCAIFLFLLIKGELKILKEMRILSGIVIITLIGLPWYLAEYLIHGQVFLDFALGFLFLSRFQGAVCGHTGPWYYYFLALILGFAPWSQFIPFAFWRAYKEVSSPNSQLRTPMLLSLCFVIPAFIVFSVAKTKIPNYILPLYPFLAIMVGKLWAEVLSEPENKFSAPQESKTRINSRFDKNGTANLFAGSYGITLSNILFAVVIALIFIGCIMIANSNYPTQYISLLPSLYTLAAILVLGGVISITAYFLKKYTLSFAAIPTMVFIITLILTVWALPEVENFKGAKELGKELNIVIKPNQIIAAYNVGNRPSVVLHSPKPVKFLETEKELSVYINHKKGYVFTLVEEYEKMKERLPARTKVLAKKGDLLILY
ncbi:MAG: glycosyltransferase family 39 protein [bacterium]